MRKKVVAVMAPLIAFLGATAHGAELTCFADLSEAAGFYFVRFAIEQGVTAKKCDDTYALWNPPLFGLSSRVMASGINQEEYKKAYAAAAERLTKRLGISSSELFALASQRTVPFLAPTVSRQDCDLLAKKLQIRLASPDDLVFYVTARAAQEERAGHICR
jgi:hypothetical protein